jgi:NAD(P)-dependent dehydrogenase (short-subunit alcohol dehydrogenase family)
LCASSLVQQIAFGKLDILVNNAGIYEFSPLEEITVPQIKRNVLNACAQIVSVDGTIQGGEAELLRAIGRYARLPGAAICPTTESWRADCALEAVQKAYVISYAHWRNPPE